jgi:antirestriction protein ArdC
MVADLEASVKAVVESGQLHRWLDAMASNGLQRWSANNRLLAVVQMLQRDESLEGLHLMGFRQWERFNRKVSKGAKAVWILAPVTRKLVEEDEDGNRTEKHRVVGFKGVPVFNVSDTHGDPLPESPAKPAPGEATPGTLEGLRDRVAQAGYAYEETVIPDCRPETGEGTLGYTDPRSKRIVVDSRLSPAQRASTVAHELGHVHCGHVDGDYGEYQRHRGRMETEAEVVAFMVCRSRGATREQAEAFSPGYIAAWSRGDAKVMHAAVERATSASNKILDGHWPAS